MAAPPGARLEGWPLGDPSPLPIAAPAPGATGGVVGESTAPLDEMETTVVMPWAFRFAIIAASSPFFMPRSFCQ